jgi:hypothetical protein
MDSGPKFFYDLLIPTIRGRDRRQFFNSVSGVMPLWFGVLGALLGWGMRGPQGVILGLGAGVVFGDRFLTKNRYYRP